MAMVDKSGPRVSGARGHGGNPQQQIWCWSPWWATRGHGCLVLVAVVATCNHISDAGGHGGQLVAVGVWCWWPWWQPATTLLLLVAMVATHNHISGAGGHGGKIHGRMCPGLENTCPGLEATYVHSKWTHMSEL